MSLHGPLALLAAVACLGAGCGADDEREQPPAAPAGPTDLRVEVRSEGPEGPVRRDRLRCPGDARCARLAARDFEPTPAGTACTDIYGGPGVATVTGRLEGARIVAAFSRSNGCEIARWDAVAWLLGDSAPP